MRGAEHEGQKSKYRKIRRVPTQNGTHVVGSNVVFSRSERQCVGYVRKITEISEAVISIRQQPNGMHRACNIKHTSTSTTKRISQTRQNKTYRACCADSNCVASNTPSTCCSTMSTPSSTVECSWAVRATSSRRRVAASQSARGGGEEGGGMR